MKSISLLISWLLPFASYSQSGGTAIVAVRYVFLHIQDTTDRSAVTRENMVLYLGGSASVYTSLDKMNRASEMRLGYESAMRELGKTPDPLYRPIATVSYFKEPSVSRLVTVEVAAGKAYTFSESLPVIDWNIEQQTKTIGGFPCQKATAAFRGRRYTAWFSTKLSYNNGPWKLGGLPGLILEAEDDSKEVVFEFAGLDDVSAQQVALTPEKDAIVTTPAELQLLKDAIRKNPSVMHPPGAAGGSVRGETSAKSAMSPADKKKEFNNPIEKSL